MKSRDEHLVEVYVWELPVRIFHWVNFACILILCITGILIAHPLTIMNEPEASFSFFFGKVRFIHFVTAFIFLFNFMFRIYWGFAGNRYANWRNFIPLRKVQWQELFEVIKVDILMIKNKPVESIGHNALANLIYFCLFIAFVLQCITGFGLYAQMSTALLPKAFAWVIPLLGGDYIVRTIHHFLMWFFMIFTIIHVYLVFYHDYIERRGVTSSMIGGWKFIEKKIVEADKKAEKQK